MIEGAANVGVARYLAFLTGAICLVFETRLMARIFSRGARSAFKPAPEKPARCYMANQATEMRRGNEGAQSGLPRSTFLLGLTSPFNDFSFELDSRIFAGRDRSRYKLCAMTSLDGQTASMHARVTEPTVSKRKFSFCQHFGD